MAKRHDGAASRPLAYATLSHGVESETQCEHAETMTNQFPP